MRSKYGGMKTRHAFVVGMSVKKKQLGIFVTATNTARKLQILQEWDGKMTDEAETLNDNPEMSTSETLWRMGDMVHSMIIEPVSYTHLTLPTICSV